jgi:hypothetical protein
MTAKDATWTDLSKEERAIIDIANMWAFLRTYCIIYSKMGPDFFRAKYVAEIKPGPAKITVQEVPNPNIGRIPGKTYREATSIELDKHLVIDSVYDPTFTLLVAWGFDEVAKILPYWQTNDVLVISF